MSNVTSRHAAVASAEPNAVQAGLEILRRGGNAVDAAVGTMLAECVTESQNTGIGGYGGAMLVHLAREKRTVSIDFDSVAPLAASPGMFGVDPADANGLSEDGAVHVPGNANEFGYLAVTVPGNVAGLAHALRRYGTMSWADVSAPAIRLAEEGFTVYRGLAHALHGLYTLTDETSRRAMFGECEPPAEGDHWAQRDLARLLHTLADEGPEAFYGPEIAGRIVDQVAEHGGILQLEDFGHYTVLESEPVSVKCGEWEFLTAPLPAGGVTVLQIIKAMHALGVDPKDYASGRYHHLLIEVSKLAWLDRFTCLGDPAFIDDPTPRLLSDSHIGQMIAQVREYVPARAPIGQVSAEGHTVHTVAADSDRNMVSLTATQGGLFGSRVVVEGLGLVLGHGMSRFDPIPGRPNSIEPGKRVLHNMSPMMLARNGHIAGVYGLPGGRRIINVAVQIGLALTWFGMQPAEAIAAPRIHLESREPVMVSGLPEAMLGYLESAGHQLNCVEHAIAGPASVVTLDPENGLLYAASQYGDSSVGVI